MSISKKIIITLFCMTSCIELIAMQCAKKTIINFTQENFNALLGEAKKVNPRIDFNQLLKPINLHNNDILQSMTELAKYCPNAKKILHDISDGYDRIYKKEFLNNFREHNIFYKKVPQRLKEFIDFVRTDTFNNFLQTQSLKYAQYNFFMSGLIPARNTLPRKNISFEAEMEQGLKNSKEWLDNFHSQFESKFETSSHYKLFKEKITNTFCIVQNSAQNHFNILKQKFENIKITPQKILQYRKQIIDALGATAGFALLYYVMNNYYDNSRIKIDDQSKKLINTIEENLLENKTNKNVSYALWFTSAVLMTSYILYWCVKKPTFEQLVKQYVFETNEIDDIIIKRNFYDALQKYGYTSPLYKKRAELILQRIHA